MIITKEDGFFLIKIYKEYLKEFDIFDKNSISELFQDILGKLKKKYELSGLIDVNVYVNSLYGMIIEIHPVYSYFDEIDMKIKFYLDAIFLNEIDENHLLDYSDVYYYKDKFYGIYQASMDSPVIYKDSEEILEKGIKVC